MLVVLSICSPFFILIFLGSALRYFKFLNINFYTGLSKFAFYIAMPAYIGLAIAEANFNNYFNYKFLINYETVTIIIFCFSAFVSILIIKIHKNEIGIFGLNCSYPNMGYIGIPLSLTVFGYQATIPLALILFSDTLVLITLTILFLSFSKSKLSFLDRILEIIKLLFKNPLILSILIGIYISINEINVFPVIKNTLEVLSNAAVPTALISLGSMLVSEMKFNKIYKDMLLISFFKLILHPILVFLIFQLIPIEKDLWMKTAILIACLPVAANVFVFANQYEEYEVKSSQAITFTTFISTISVPIWLYLILNYI